MPHQWLADGVQSQHCFDIYLASQKDSISCERCGKGPPVHKYANMYRCRNCWQMQVLADTVRFTNHTMHFCRCALCSQCTEARAEAKDMGCPMPLQLQAPVEVGTAAQGSAQPQSASSVCADLASSSTTPAETPGKGKGKSHLRARLRGAGTDANPWRFKSLSASQDSDSSSSAPGLSPRRWNEFLSGGEFTAED